MYGGFGRGVKAFNPTAIPYNYKFGSKELQETGFYDFGARNYMPDVGRWFNADPMAELSPNLTPYRYAFNNPILFTDPDGMYEGGDGEDDSDRDNYSGGFDIYLQRDGINLWDENKSDLGNILSGNFHIGTYGIRGGGDGEDDGHWVGSNGQLLYDDGVNDNKLYYAADNDIKNATLVAENGNVKDQYALGDMISAMACSLGMPTTGDFAFTLNVDYTKSGESTFTLNNKEYAGDWRTQLGKIYRNENTKFNLKVDLSKNK